LGSISASKVRQSHHAYDTVQRRADRTSTSLDLLNPLV
jgi:hypothetical protein